MLAIEDREHFDKVKAKAMELGLLAKLQETLDYLGGYACDVEDDGPPHRDRYGRLSWPSKTEPDRTHFRLYSDFAPLSFYFVMELRQPDGSYRRWFNGGAIFYRGAESGVGGPQFSCTLSGRSDARWEVHT